MKSYGAQQGGGPESAASPAIPLHSSTRAVTAISALAATFPYRLKRAGIRLIKAPKPNSAGIVPSPNACMIIIPVNGDSAAAERATIAYKTPHGKNAAAKPSPGDISFPHFRARFDIATDSFASTPPDVGKKYASSNATIIKTPPTIETHAVAFCNPA